MEHLAYQTMLDNIADVALKSTCNVTNFYPIANARSLMAERFPQQQQPVISIRVSDELRFRLDKLREIIALKTGTTVSTSEAAKQLLESARDDRLELANLLTTPTDSLLIARRKADAKMSLSQAEWAMIANYCWYGAEAYSDTARTKISNDSLIGILRAFLAVYDLRKAKKTREDAFYLSNLPPDGRSAIGDSREIGRDEVCHAVNQTIQALRKTDHGQGKPIQVARNLYHLLDEGEFPNVQKLNRTLWPYWPILWRVCARGHYFRHGQPLSEKKLIDNRFEGILPPPLPSFQGWECSLSLTRLQRGGFSLCLHLPGRLSPQYPISEYPVIAEFRAMLEEFDPNQEDSCWRGYYFFAYTAKSDTGGYLVSFRSEANGITFTFSQSDWSAIRDMMRRAWEKPEVRRLWDQQATEYGVM